MSRKGEGAEFFDPPRDLKNKVGKMTKTLPDALEAELQNQIDKMRPVYLVVFDNEIATLRRRCQLASGPMVDDATKDAIYPALHRIRGEAAMNGLEAASIVADGLCKVFDAEGADGRVPLQLLTLHIDALLAIRKTADDPAATSALLDGLVQAREKLMAD